MATKPVPAALLGMGIFAACAALPPEGRCGSLTVSAQGASISAAGGTIVATRVPVQVGTGAPSYFDVTITLTGTAAGGLPAGIKVTGTSAPSQIIETNGFLQGTYKDAADNTYSVTGPGVGPDGATAWSLTLLSQGPGFPCELFGVAWYTATGANNPEAPRVTAAGITTTAYSFGLSGGASCAGSEFSNGALIGVAHSGSGITISSFSSIAAGKLADQDSPTSTWTLTPQ
jgi:hypothetical protein